VNEKRLATIAFKEEKRGRESRVIGRELRAIDIVWINWIKITFGV